MKHKAEYRIDGRQFEEMHLNKGLNLKDFKKRIKIDLVIRLLKETNVLDTIEMKEYMDNENNVTFKIEIDDRFN